MPIRFGLEEFAALENVFVSATYVALKHGMPPESLPYNYRWDVPREPETGHFNSAAAVLESPSIKYLAAVSKRRKYSYHLP
jgi:hypothetical protein